MSDCAHPEAFQSLAMVTVRANGDREVAISAASFEGYHSQSFKLDPCRFDVASTGHSQLSCDPMEIVSGDLTVAIDHLELSTDDAGVHGVASAQLSHASRGLLGSFYGSIEPGQPVALRVCTRRGQASCAE